MGSSPKQQMGKPTAPMMMSYGGTNMSQADAQKKYQEDMAAWRAPTTTGTGTAGMETGTTVAGPTAAVAGGEGAAPVHLGVPTTNWTANPFSGGGPAIPNVGILPTAPVAVAAARNNLATSMSPAAQRQLGPAGYKILTGRNDYRGGSLSRGGHD